ncbi:MAG: hypothetical protein R3Y39_03030 [Rikenellaceae bacterium]
MEAAEIIKSYPWYIPAHVAMWREQPSGAMGGVTELIVMNHPEAVVEPEQVDMEFLISLVNEPRPIHMDAISALEQMQPVEQPQRSTSQDLIDKFLEVKDLRIVPPADDEAEVVDLMWEEADSTRPYTAEDDLASEELARIYLNQRLYNEANDIYNRLFLLYSEKSVYFATQIEKIDKILNKGAN